MRMHMRVATLRCTRHWLLLLVAAPTLLAACFALRASTVLRFLSCDSGTATEAFLATATLGAFPDMTMRNGRKRANAQQQRRDERAAGRRRRAAAGSSRRSRRDSSGSQPASPTLPPLPASSHSLFVWCLFRGGTQQCCRCRAASPHAADGPSRARGEPGETVWGDRVGITETKA